MKKCRKNTCGQKSKSNGIRHLSIFVFEGTELGFGVAGVAGFQVSGRILNPEEVRLADLVSALVACPRVAGEFFGNATLAAE